MQSIRDLVVPLVVVCLGCAGGRTTVRDDQEGGGSEDVDGSAAVDARRDSTAVAADAPTGQAPDAEGEPAGARPDAAAGGDAGLADDAAPDRTGAGDTAGTPRRLRVYVSGGGGAITYFALDPMTGALRREGATMGLSPTYLAFTADGRRVYGPSGNPTRVYAWSINEATGALTSISGGDQPTGSNGSAHLSVHPGGKHVLVSHYSGAQVAVLPIAANGGLDAATDGRTTAAEAHQVVTDRNGAFVFVPCRAGDAIMQYRFDAATGKLTPNNPARVAAAPGAGPRHMDFHPTERWAYVLNEVDGTLTSYTYDNGTGRLSDAQTISAVPGGVRESASAHVLVHPSGRFLFASNRSHNSVGLFALNPTTGRPTAVSWQTAGGAIRTPRDFAIDPTGKWLLVANETPGTVVVFGIDPATGMLIRAGAGADGLTRPQYIGVLAL
jgi:6-phosphogluconolactonase